METTTVRRPTEAVTIDEVLQKREWDGIVFFLVCFFLIYYLYCYIINGMFFFLVGVCFLLLYLINREWNVCFFLRCVCFFVLF